MPDLLLHTLAHARTGDKGDRLNISLIAYAPELFPLLRDTVTERGGAGRCSRTGSRARCSVTIVPKLYAMNFVLDGVLDGGVTQALNVDSHGKTQSFRLLGHKIAVPDDLVRFAKTG